MVELVLPLLEIEKKMAKRRQLSTLTQYSKTPSEWTSPPQR